jgi:peptidoglycan/xylan/chitin deacetylase (PgdA/CDA1 family)
MLFTTSWDDGYKLDLRIADLLDTYGCKGTFYVCPRKQHDKEVMSTEEIALLRERHEIGAHTLRHSKLTEISAIDAKAEITGSKEWVEQVTGAPCSMFCYPYGFVNDEVKQLVQDAGFKGARTTERQKLTTSDPFAMPTTLQITPFPKRKVWSKWWHPLDINGPRRARRKGLKQLGVKTEDMKDWLSLAKALFDSVQNLDNSNHQFHLWGHSHEVEKYNMWEDLEAFLAHVQSANVECVPNSKLL